MRKLKDVQDSDSESDLQLVACPHLRFLELELKPKEQLEALSDVEMSVSKRPRWSNWVHGFWLLLHVVPAGLSHRTRTPEEAPCRLGPRETPLTTVASTAPKTFCTNMF